MVEHTGDNLRRLMAERGLSTKDVIEITGLDRRTVGGILAGTHRTHPRTITRLAESLEVSADEFFITPGQLVYRHFDAQTNAVVEEVVDEHPDLFQDWTEADFDELHSRMGTGGGLTRDGAVAAAEGMNHRRELHRKLDLLLETSHADVIGGMIDAAYERATVEEG